MDTEKKNKIREIVRDVMSDKVNSLINDDLFMDNELRDRVIDRLFFEIMDDEEVEECFLYGEDGVISDGVTQMFIDTLTDAFMERFK